MPTLPRRHFLAILTAGTGMALSTWTCREPGAPPGPGTAASPGAEPAAYVDYEGWMLAPGDRERIGGLLTGSDGETAP